jgi:pimeloyl-ACP methyl ester carboxylesterase
MSDRRLILGLTPLIGFAMLAIATADAAPAHHTAPAIRPNLAAVQLQDATCPFQAPDRVTCSKLEVPENWSLGINARRISMMVATVHAEIGPRKKQRDSIVFLPGGPGLSTFNALALIAASPAAVDRDVLVIEPRGYGFADPALLCEGGVAGLAACYAKFKDQGVDVQQYTSEPAAQDLEALRRALRIGRWNVMGVSFGTFSALQYARLYPDGVRSLILDSVYPPQAGYDWNRASTLNAFSKVFEDCRSTETCDRAYPDLRNRFIQVLREAQTPGASFAGKPVTMQRIFDRIYTALYDSGSLRYTPMLVDAAARKDFATLFGPLEPAAQRRDFDGLDPTKEFAIGLNAAIECADDIPFQGSPEARVAYKNPWPEDIKARITPEGWDYGRRCASWPMRPSPAVLNRAVSSDAPTLIFSGAYDPACPTEFAEAAALHLSHATLLIDPQTSHSVLASGEACLFEALGAFLDDPSAPVATGCAAKIPPAVWVVRR